MDKPTLVLGASGATGRLVVKELLARGRQVRALVREGSSTGKSDHEHLTVVRASVTELDDSALSGLLDGCGAVVSCLGHNMSLKGIYGPPRRLVNRTIINICRVIKENKTPVRVILMNTSGYVRPGEQTTLPMRALLSLIRILLPPQRDNEAAAASLQNMDKGDHLQWVVVRPDKLVDREEAGSYELHPSPIRSPLFDPGETSRINVAHFISELICHDELWRKWESDMPVIYNRD